MVRLGIWVLVLCTCSFGAPHSRYCGTDLANIIAMVCQDRGYNMAFTQVQRDPTYERRFKRGIVDECCKKGCSRRTLEAYCSPGSTLRPDTPQIRKRSDHSGKKQDDERVKIEPSLQSPYRYSISELQENFGQERGHKLENGSSKHRNRVFYLSKEEYREDLELRQKDKVRKKIREGLGEYGDLGFYPRSNDALSPEEVMAEVVWSSDQLDFFTTPRTILLRHHRDHFLERNRHLTSKKKDDQESSSAPQIGTVSPYFQGRTLVLSSSRKGMFSYHGK